MRWMGFVADMLSEQEYQQIWWSSGMNGREDLWSKE
jgi:hypothetical protein